MHYPVHVCLLLKAIPCALTLTFLLKSFQLLNKDFAIFIYSNGEQDKLDCYRKFKLNFEFESYLVNVKNDAHRKTLHTLNFRVLSRTLAVETGRYIGIERKIDFVFFLFPNTTSKRVSLF